MCEPTKNLSSLQERMSFITYSTLYNNLLNRLPWREEVIETDFFTQFHVNDQAFLQHHQDNPTIYHCNSRIGYVGRSDYKSSYLVVGGLDRVVLLLTPDEAQLRNLPYLSVLEGNFFRPQLTSPIAYWQAHIEPVSHDVENVLFSQPNFLHTLNHSFAPRVH